MMTLKQKLRQLLGHLGLLISLEKQAKGDYGVDRNLVSRLAKRNRVAVTQRRQEGNISEAQDVPYTS